MKNDGERLASMETEVKNLGGKLNGMENSMASLHGKVDAFTKLLADKYMTTATFEQYKETVKEHEKNDLLQKIILVIVTAVITGLIAFFLRELQV